MVVDVLFFWFLVEFEIKLKEELEEEKYNKMIEFEFINEESELENGWWFGLCLNIFKKIFCFWICKKIINDKKCVEN